MSLLLMTVVAVGTVGVGFVCGTLRREIKKDENNQRTAEAKPPERDAILIMKHFYQEGHQAVLHGLINRRKLPFSNVERNAIFFFFCSSKVFFERVY